MPRSSLPPRRGPHGIGPLVLVRLVREQLALRVLHHQVIDQRQRHHGLHHGHRPGQDAGIVPALSAQLHLLTVARHGHLSLTDGGGGLERHVDHHVLAVADAALDAARPIRFRPCGPRDGIDVELVVVVLAGQERPLESVPALESLGGRYGHASLGEVGLQLVEHGRAESRRDVPGHAGDDAADAVPGLADLVDASQHLLRPDRIGTPNDVGIHLLHREGRIVHVAPDVLYLRHVRQDLDAVVHG
mmetsp:Transcript_20464/g.41445  ORF Transcript_20464/g.41445 Transcript_20464/m.41445 type:complete len:245 (+) Transcript_20464:296-1030(+)